MSTIRADIPDPADIEAKLQPGRSDIMAPTNMWVL